MVSTGAGETVSLPAASSSASPKAALQSSLGPSRSSLNVAKTCVRSVVSGPPSAGSIRSSGSWKPLTTSSHTSSTTRSRTPSAMVVAAAWGDWYGGPSHVATTVAGASSASDRPSAHTRPASTWSLTTTPSVLAESTLNAPMPDTGTARMPAPKVSLAAAERHAAPIAAASFQSRSSSTRPCWCSTPE